MLGQPTCRSAASGGIQHVINAIEKRLDEARERDTYEDMRVDLLAIIQYIQRSLTLIESEFPPSADSP